MAKTMINKYFCRAISGVLGQRHKLNKDGDINYCEPDGKPVSAYHLMGTWVPDLPSGEG
jgi:hypothetical protein